jgi:hypothetical protein
LIYFGTVYWGHPYWHFEGHTPEQSFASIPVMLFIITEEMSSTTLELTVNAQ